MSHEIDKAAEAATANYRRLLHLKVFELVLGDMVREVGVHRVRQLLIGVADELAEFDKGE